MSACSSIRFPSPMTIGPASAMMRALGWITVRGPAGTARRHPAVAPGGGTAPGRGTGPYRWSRPRGSRSPRTPRRPARSSRCGERRGGHGGVRTGTGRGCGEGTARPGGAVGGMGERRERSGRSGLTSSAPSPPWPRPAAPARGGAPGVRAGPSPARALLPPPLEHREHREHREGRERREHREGWDRPRWGKGAGKALG